MSQNNLGSLLNDGNSTDDLRPEQLSGDQNASKSLIATEISGNKANFLLTVTTIMKGVIGAGLIALPFTVSALGYVLSLIMFAIVLVLVQFGSVLLLKAKNLSRHSNFSSIFYHIFRTKAAQTIGNATVCLSNAGTCIAQMSIIKGSVHSIILNYIEDQQQKKSFWISTTFIVLVAAGLQLPFIFVNKIQRLRFISFAGIGGVVVYIVVLTITFFTMMKDPLRDWNCSDQMSPIGNDFFKMVIVMPNMMLALSYQQTFYPIYKGLKESRDEKMQKASLTALLVCSIFYILIGNMGYCLFGNEMQSNFLLSFDSKNTNEVLYLMLNISFLISVFFSYSIMFFGARNNFIAISKNIILKTQGYTRQISKDDIQQIGSYIQAQDTNQRKRKARIYFILYTIIIFTLINLTAIFVDNIQDALNVVGAISSNLISFIYPGLFYIMLIRIKKKPKKIHYFIAIAVVVVFVPFGIFAVVTQFLGDAGGH